MRKEYVYWLQAGYISCSTAAEHNKGQAGRDLLASYQSESVSKSTHQFESYVKDS